MAAVGFVSLLIPVESRIWMTRSNPGRGTVKVVTYYAEGRREKLPLYTRKCAENDASPNPEVEVASLSSLPGCSARSIRLAYPSLSYLIRLPS